MINLAAPKLSAFVGSVAFGGMVAQTIAPNDPGWEKLGVLSIVVAGSYFLTKYFMAEISKKDDLLRELHKLQSETNERMTAQLVSVVQEGNAVKLKITEALHELTNALKERR